MNHSFGGWWWRLKLSPDKTAECSKALAPDPDLWLQKQFCVLSSLRMQTLRDVSRGDNNSFLYLLTKIKRRLLLGRKLMTNLDSILKQRYYFANKGPSSQGYGFSSSHVWMWELDYKESWVLKNWCSWTVVLEKTLESPLDCKEVQPVHPKDQSWVFIGGTDIEAETPILWPPKAKSWLIWKDPDAGKDWRQEEKVTTEDCWMASLTQWTWVWVDSWSWWWTGRSGMQRFMGLQRVGYDWATELNWM